MRLEDIARTIEEFASLRFDARAAIGPDGDIIDAVAAGVNFLGEELEASYHELESRVAERTAELAIANGELARRARHDDLTGLLNHAGFWERLSHRLALADRRKTCFALLYLDVDDFKTINDTLGHAAGDRLLIELAARLRAALRRGDTAARLGGDEFVVLLDEVATTGAALVLAERLGEALQAPYGIGPDGWTATVSIGVAVSSEGIATVDEIVAAADTAMYDAKRRGGGRRVLYSEDLHGRPGR